MVDDVATLRLCVLLLVPPTQTSALLTFPFLIRVFNSSFDPSLWGNWFRFFTDLCICTASVLIGLGVCLVKSVALKTGLAALVVATGGTVINILFGLRTPTTILCTNGLTPLCMESLPRCSVSSLPGSDGKHWEAFMFSFARCVQLVLLPVLIQLIYRKASFPRLDRKVCDTESTVVVLNVSGGEALPTDLPSAHPSKYPIKPMNPIPKPLVLFDLGTKPPHKAVKPPTKLADHPHFAPINPLFSHATNNPPRSIPNKRVLRRP